MNAGAEVGGGANWEENWLDAWSEGEVWFRRDLEERNLPWMREELLPAVPVEAQGHYGLRVDQRVRVDGVTYEPGETVVVDSRRDLLRLAGEVGGREWIFPWYPRFVPSSLLMPLRRRISLTDYRREHLGRFGVALAKTLGLGAAWHFLGELGFIFLILAVMWGLYPLVDAVMALMRRVDRLSVAELNSRLVNFEFFRRWIAARKSPPVLVGVVVLGLLFVAQILVGVDRSILAAALVREEVLPGGEWWRVVTTGLLHGSALHVAFNGFALHSLGRILTALLGAPLLGFVFLFAVVLGSLASLEFSPAAASVGASGGILGCLGFLLVAAWKFRGIIPGYLGSSLIQTILVLAIFGLVGNEFIDNAAHAGGLLAGIGLGWIMFPALRLDAGRPGLLVRALSLSSLLVLVAGVGWIGWVFWHLGFP